MDFTPLNPWIGKSLVLAGLIASIAIRIPHARRDRQLKIDQDRRGPLEVFLLSLMGAAVLLLPLAGILTPLLSFADYPFSVPALAGGAGCLMLALWLFHRSHKDLGTNWSVTLQLREQHRLVKDGVYRRIRHPMYTSLFLHAIAQALLLPNGIAGPAYLIAFTLMFALRLGPEEKMMLDRFGPEYEAYRGETKRLIPFLW